jgi:hypothetical protein
VHHAGLLPIVKEVIEMLFCRGVIKDSRLCFEHLDAVLPSTNQCSSSFPFSFFLHDAVCHSSFT